MIIKKHLIISGKVQGVGFRYWMQNLATNNNISGWVKNIFLKTIQVKTGKFQKKDETNLYLQPDYRINSISELSNLLGIELTEKNY
jgi:hypothetical protein